MNKVKTKSDVGQQAASSGDVVAETKVLVIGGGYSGIGAAIRLKRSGMDDFIVIEKAAKLGGTWRENSYPDCGADTPSIIYSFSFARNPDWDRTFAKQPQIEQYLDDTAERYGVPEHVRFNTEAVMGEWDEAARRWRVETNNGTIVAKYVLACAGPMHDVAMPQIPGVEKFAGKAFHSATWDHSVDLTGKRVAVIGTGASAIQFVPEIQPKAGNLVVFQRTAPWVLPKMDREASAWKKRLYKRFPWINRAVAHAIYMGSEALQIAQRHPKAMQQIQKIGTRHMRRQVSDPELRKQFEPQFTLGCKRILFSNGWYKALTASNTEVVPHGVEQITERGLIDTEGVEREVDVIIYGTGFRVTDPDIAYRVKGRDGQLLADHWQGSPQAYMSTSIHGFPNAFVVLGPNVGNGHGSVSTLIELLTDYIVRAIEYAEDNDLASLEVKRHVQDVYNAEVQDSLRGTVFNAGGCASYYLDSNGRNSSIYPWTTLRFRKSTARFDVNDYEITAPGQSDSTDRTTRETVTA